MHAKYHSNFVEHLSWDAVAARLAKGVSAILPIGAGAKEHGFHLPMNTDRVQAELLAARIADHVDTLIWPTVSYGYYPAFTEYSGSASLSEEAFERVVGELARALLGYGCKAVFVLDTGISTIASVDNALSRLGNANVLHLKIHDGPKYSAAAERLTQQVHGNHADELETSLMLALAPHLVDMQRAEASPSTALRNRRTVDAIGPVVAQLQPVGKFWQSDARNPCEGRHSSCGDDGRPSRAGVRFSQALCKERKQEGCLMMRRNPWRVGIVVIAGIAFVVGGLTLRSAAQSEYSGGQGFPYNAFDQLRATDIDVEGGVIHLAFAPGRIELPKATIVEWVARSAKAITTYYGRFPVKSARILIVPSNGARVQGGTTWGYRGGAIRINLGSDADEDDLRRDWVMVHEMVHLALPDMEDRYAWLSEGLAVYIEPIARVQAGDLPVEGVWLAMMRDMPKGLPGLGDKGLDNTSTWGRKYWGGAMYCLMADVEIRKRTNNRVGLQDAMRGVLAAGGNHEVDWPMARVISVADAAVGLNVLTRLHDEMGAKAAIPDLGALWRDLGLRQNEAGIEIDNSAPLAAIRISVTEKSSR